ncbi:MAG: hypothetical protein J6Y53_06195 [Alphaproteobacteria bacterium]|nr:hypothetical protein [Alphaproteobacteria bacterium]
MKRMFVLLGASLSLVACASDYELDEGYMDEPCPYQNQARAAQPAPAPAPAPAPVVQPAPVYQPAPVVQPVYTECARPAPQVVYTQPSEPCCGEMRTVREPVEVVYRRTTYGTVYEPRHFQNVAYERQSVNGGYYQQPTMVQQPAYDPDYYVPAKVQAPAAPAAQKPNAPVVIVPVQ